MLKNTLCLLAMSLCLLLTACGFHLRGQAFLPPELRVLYLQSYNPYGPLVKQMRRTLMAMKIRLVQSQRDAPLTLAILREQEGEQATSFSPTTQIQTYTLTYAVVYQVMDRENQVLSGPHTIHASRSFTANPHQTIGNSYEKNMLIQDIRRDVTTQILNRLNSKSMLQALADNS